MTPPVVFIVCSGLGRVNRGYETFSREVFDVLVSAHELDVHLLKGAGPASQKEQVVRSIGRFSGLGKFLQRFFKWDAYLLEQLTFAIFSIPKLIKHKPHVILYSDFLLGVFYWHMRKWFKWEYKLLYSNGAPNGPPFSRTDFVQQLLPFYKEQATAAGEDPSRHFVLPYAVEMPSVYESKTKDEHKKLLGLTGIVVLCVAAINDSHKRITYLIDEINSLQRTDITLVVLGQQNEESLSIIQHGKQLLSDRFIAKTVNKEELGGYYKAADIFVLPSLTEGLPRVMLEALSFGLPVLSHDYPVGKNVLKEHGHYADFTQKAALRDLLLKVLQEETGGANALERTVYVRDHFSWSALKKEYISMILTVAHA